MRIRLSAQYVFILFVLSLLPMTLCSCSRVRQYRETRRNRAIYKVLDDHDTQTLNKLLARGLDPNCVIARTNDERPVHPWVDGAPLIFHAVVRDDTAITVLLLAHGADLKARNQSGMTPLMMAANMGNLEITKILVEQGADVNAVSARGYNVFVVCIDADLRFRHRFKDNPKDPYFPLKLSNMKPLVEYLAAHGADINRKDNLLEQTPRDLAEDRGDTEMAMLLGRLGGVQGNRTGVLEYEKTHGPAEAASFIDVAIQAGRMDVVYRYLDRGFDPNAIVDADAKWTLLHYAAGDNDLKLAERLIAAGAKLQGKARGGMTPLDVACVNNAVGVINLLLKHGANVNENAPLAAACGEGYADVARLLIAHGADVNAKTKRGATALHAAAEADVEPNPLKATRPQPFLMKDPETGLPDEHRNLKEVVELLLTNGADVNAVDLRDGTPLDIARRQMFPEMAALLQAHGGKTCKEMGYHKEALIYGVGGEILGGWQKTK